MGLRRLVILVSLFFPVKSSSYPNGAILVRDNYIRCKDVDLHTHIPVCEIHNQEDEVNIKIFGLSGCSGSTLECAEGDIKTCMPLVTVNNLHYQCFCHSDEEDNSVTYSHTWTQWQRLDHIFRHFQYKRTLLIDNTVDVAEEYITEPQAVYIVANHSLPDTVYSASSELNDLHAARRARIDNYFDSFCCWGSLDTDTYPWLKISLPNQYIVTGVYIKRRCDAYTEYPTVVDVMTSVDDETWQDVVVRENIGSRYSSDDPEGFVNIWFSKKYTTRFWKIYLFQVFVLPRMKCDLYGHVL